MILREKASRVWWLACSVLPCAAWLLSTLFVPSTVLAQKPPVAKPSPSVTPAPTPLPSASPAPSVSLTLSNSTPTPAAAVTPDPLIPDAAALPLDGSSPALPPLITASPAGAPAATPKPTLPPATVTELDSAYNEKVSARVPVGEHEGLPITLLQAVRSTLSNNAQVQLSQQDSVLSRSFLQQNTGVFDSQIRFNGSKSRNVAERSPESIRKEYTERRMKALLARQFLGSADRLQADLDRSKATNTPPQEDFSTGNSSISSQNGQLSDSTVVFLNDNQQALANAQKQQSDAFTTLITQIAAQNASPAQLAQLQALQQTNVSLAQQAEQQFITAFRLVGNDLTNSLRTLPQIVQVNNTANYTAGVSKLFRNGVTVEPIASWSQSDPGGGPAVNQAKVGVMVNIPLLRGYGVEATAAPETAAKIDYEASQLSTRHTAALSVYQTTQLYWTVVAAQRRVDLLRQSQGVSFTLYDLSQQLVKADEMAPADINIIAARSNDTTIQVYSAELALLDAQQQLAVQIGQDPDKMATPLSPADGFLDERSPEEVHRVSREALVATAFGKRSDLAAARKLQASGKVLARAAQLNLKPQLDFNFNLTWGAINEGSHYEQYIQPFTTSYNGPSFLATVNFNWPVANNTQRGLYNQAKASLRQRDISAFDLQRVIASSVVFSVGSVENALKQLREALTARTNYRKALDAEYAKLKVGNSTFLNAVETEQLYTSTGLNVISAQFQYATALARVRYETGTLLPPAADAVIGWSELTTLPVPAPDPTTARLPRVTAPVTQGKLKQK